MDRKQIVHTLEELTGVKAKYLGAPSFEYQIAVAEETYTIDRFGKVITSAGLEIEFERLLSGAQKENETTKMKEVTNETLEFEISLPMEGHTGITLRNLVNMIYSKQVLIKKVFELEEDIVNVDFIEEINSVNIQTLEEFKAEIAGKEDIGYRKIEFDFTNNTITFKFARNLQEPDKLEAYTQFVTLLSQNARALKYVSSKPTATDNFKFTMRTWLIRLGFVGKEYKKSREVILKNLEGNGAFRRPKERGEVEEI